MAVISRPTPTEDYSARDKTRSTEDRFLGDQLLRQYGFVIESRPTGATATWTRRGRSYTDRDARLLAMAERARSIKELESR